MCFVMFLFLEQKIMNIYRAHELLQVWFLQHCNTNDTFVLLGWLQIYRSNSIFGRNPNLGIQFWNDQFFQNVYQISHGVFGGKCKNRYISEIDGCPLPLGIHLRFLSEESWRRGLGDRVAGVNFWHPFWRCFAVWDMCSSHLFEHDFDPIFL